MTDTRPTPASQSRVLATAATFSIDDVSWGYKVRSGRSASFAVAMGQAVSFFFGVCFLTAALGIVLLPTLFFDGDFSVMRVGSAGLFAAVAAYLLWFASRGTKPEVHIDTTTNEIREVISHRAGRPTIVGLYGFETVSGVFLEQNDETGLSQIVLQVGSAEPAIFVAEGTDAQLIPLRDRIAQDLLDQAKVSNGKAA